MKLLLTSAGLCNKSIVNALASLIERPFTDLSLSFIPTAANVEEGSKDWLIDDLVNCKNLNLSTIDILDISALPNDSISTRLEKSDIIFFGGGDLFYLMEWVKRTGLDKTLPRMLDKKIYIGLSAGTMLTGKWWSTKYDVEYYGEKAQPIDRYNCLGLVDFFVIPHVNNTFFPKVTIETVQKLASEVKEPLYAIDDSGAVVVDGENISVVSEGEWKKFN